MISFSPTPNHQAFGVRIPAGTRLVFYSAMTRFFHTGFTTKKLVEGANIIRFDDKLWPYYDATKCQIWTDQFLKQVKTKLNMDKVWGYTTHSYNDWLVILGQAEIDKYWKQD